MFWLVALALVAGLLIAFWWTVVNSRVDRSDAAVDALSPDARTRFRKLKNLRNDLERAAERNKADASAFVVAEALSESQRLLDQSLEALRIRDRLRLEIAAGSMAERTARDLEARIASATSEEERRALEGALAAKRQELGHNNELGAGIQRIDSALQQAEATLSELRARIATHAAGGLGEAGANDMRDAVSRMKALTASVDEIEQVVGGGKESRP